MNFKKLLAVGLAATMVLGSSVTAFADEGSGTGSGKLEGSVSTEVFSVVLPVVAEDGSTLAFTLDPEGLIAKTSQAAYSGATFGEGTLFFKNAPATEDGAASYSNTSDTLTIVNKSSVQADVTVTVKVKDNTGITLSADKTFKDDTKASMYMAIVDDDNENGVAVADTNGAKVTSTIAAAAEGAYEYSWTEDDGYTYALKEDAADTLFSKYEFKLTGAANAAGDWSKLGDVVPKVELVWKVVAHSEAPSAYVSSLTVSASSPAVTLSLPDDVTVSSVVINKPAGGVVNCVAGTHYNISGSKLTFVSGPMTNNVGGTAVVTYSDGHKDTLTIE